MSLRQGSCCSAYPFPTALPSAEGGDFFHPNHEAPCPLPRTVLSAVSAMLSALAGAGADRLRGRQQHAWENDTTGFAPSYPTL